MRVEIIACRNCQQQINIMKFSTTCPHREHPKQCRLHNRYLCGNLECNSTILRLEKREKEIKNG